jgi:hypothetical protein
MKETKKPGVVGTAPAKTAATQAQPLAPREVTTDVSWGEEDATGYEAVQADDLGIPFLAICQKGSAEYDESHKAHAQKKIDGIKPGCIFNTQSRSIVYVPGGEPLLFIPCFYEKLYQEWRPRNDGGGFVKSHPNASVLAECKRNEKNDDVLPSGNIIITTAYFSGIALMGEERTRVIIPMVKTQLKKARAWLNLATNLKHNNRPLPLYANIYNLSTVVEQNDEGSWWGWKVEHNRVLRNADIEVVTVVKAIANETAENRKALPAPAANEETVY